MENKQKHLEFIQNIIDRMAGNLFFLKGWVITIITALFAWSTTTYNKEYIFIAYLIVIVFWILDGYFLSQERLFRSLYNHVRKLNEKDIDFSMDIEKYKSIDRNSWAYSMFSSTLLWFYGVLIFIMILITYLIN